MADTVLVRPAVPGDLAGIMTLENLGFGEGIREREETFRERIETFPDGTLLMCVPSYPGCVGYITTEIWPYRHTLSPDLFALDHSALGSHDPNGQELYISSMTIHPEHRQRGLGGLLFTKTFEHLLPLYPGIVSSCLIVSKTWGYACRLYEKHGFRPLFTVDAFFTPRLMTPEDGLVMRKLLKPIQASCE